MLNINLLNNILGVYRSICVKYQFLKQYNCAYIELLVLNIN